MTVTLQSKLGVSDEELRIVNSIYMQESLDGKSIADKKKNKKETANVVKDKEEVTDIVGEEYIPKSPIGAAFAVLKLLANRAKKGSTAAAPAGKNVTGVTPSTPSPSVAKDATPDVPKISPPGSTPTAAAPAGKNVTGVTPSTPSPSVAKDATPDVPKISPPGTPPGKSLTRKMDSASAAATDSNLPDVSPTTPKSNLPAVQGNRAVDPYVNKGEVLPPRSVVRSPQTNKPGIDIDGSVFKEPPKIAGSIVKKAAIPSILAAPLLLSKDTAKASDPITPADKPTMPDGSASNSRMPAAKPVAKPVAKPASKPELSADDLNSISLDLVKGNTPAVAEPLKKEKESAVDRIKNRMKEISPTVNEEEEIDFDALSESEGNATHTGKIASSVRIVKSLQRAAQNNVEVPFNFEDKTTMNISPALAKLALRYYNGLSAFEKAQAAKLMRSSFKQFLDVARRK